MLSRFRKFRITYDMRVEDTATSMLSPKFQGINEQTIKRFVKIMYAKSSKDARRKMRSKYQYNITKIYIEEVTPKWFKNLLKKTHR